MRTFFQVVPFTLEFIRIYIYIHIIILLYICLEFGLFGDFVLLGECLKLPGWGMGRSGILWGPNASESSIQVCLNWLYHFSRKVGYSWLMNQRWDTAERGFLKNPRRQDFSFLKLFFWLGFRRDLSASVLQDRLSVCWILFSFSVFHWGRNISSPSWTSTRSNVDRCPLWIVESFVNLGRNSPTIGHKCNQSFWLFVGLPVLHAWGTGTI